MSSLLECLQLRETKVVAQCQQQQEQQDGSKDSLHGTDDRECPPETDGVADGRTCLVQVSALGCQAKECMGIRETQEKALPDNVPATAVDTCGGA